MYIKYKGLKTEDITIININVAQSVDTIVEENILVINMLNENDSLRLKFIDNETAKNAQEKLFMTLGLKSPLSGVLDLTNVEIPDNMNGVQITMQDIADKFNVDLRELSIVAVPSSGSANQIDVLKEEVDGDK